MEKFQLPKKQNGLKSKNEKSSTLPVLTTHRQLSHYNSTFVDKRIITTRNSLFTIDVSYQLLTALVKKPNKYIYRKI